MDESLLLFKKGTTHIAAWRLQTPEKWPAPRIYQLCTSVYIDIQRLLFQKRNVFIHMRDKIYFTARWDPSMEHIPPCESVRVST